MKAKQPEKSISQNQIQHAVASSTAIETGTPVKTHEARLKSQNSKFRHLRLAG